MGMESWKWPNQLTGPDGSMPHPAPSHSHHQDVGWMLWKALKLHTNGFGFRRKKGSLGWSVQNDLSIAIFFWASYISIVTPILRKPFGPVSVVSGRIMENEKNVKKQWFSEFPESWQITENVKKHRFHQKPEIQKNPENEEKRCFSRNSEFLKIHKKVTHVEGPLTGHLIPTHHNHIHPQLQTFCVAVSRVHPCPSLSLAEIMNFHLLATLSRWCSSWSFQRLWLRLWGWSVQSIHFRGRSMHPSTYPSCVNFKPLVWSRLQSRGSRSRPRSSSIRGRGLHPATWHCHMSNQSSRKENWKPMSKPKMCPSDLLTHLTHSSDTYSYRIIHAAGAAAYFILLAKHGQATG